MPKVRLAVPKSSPYTNENLIIPPNMVDEDNMEGGVEGRFKAGASLDEGVSGRKSIDTSFENTSQDIVDNPRSMTNEPIGLPDLGDYPHRRY